MDNPDVSTILTLGAALAALYLGHLDFLEIQKYMTNNSAGLTVLNDPRGPVREDTSFDETTTETPGPQQVIYNSSGSNANAWHASCSNGKTNTLGDRMWCWLYNHQPNTALPANQYTGSLSHNWDEGGTPNENTPNGGWPTKGGEYYNSNGSAGIPPTGPIMWWGGGKMPLNPAFYMYLVQDAFVATPCIYAPDNPKLNSPGPMRKKTSTFTR